MDAYYHGIVRKYVIAFGNMFDNMQVERRDLNFDIIQTLDVPIAYGPKHKWLSMIRQDPNLERKPAINLPRMSFQITDYQYDPERALNKTQKCYQITSDTGVKKSTFMPVPYNFNFELYIAIENADDGAQLIEQILPYFRPEYTRSLNLIPEMNISKDVPFILNGITTEDSYEGDMISRRAIIHTLSFTAKGWLYGPVSNINTIERAIVNIYCDPGLQNKLETITNVPAQYANGSPLFSPSANAALSLPISQISSNSDYGFATTITLENS